MFGFSGGLAPASSGDRCGYIDKSGSFAIAPVYDMAWSFQDGLASVGIGDKWGYIDAKGRYVWEPSA